MDLTKQSYGLTSPNHYDHRVLLIIRELKDTFPGGSASKEAACNVRDLGSIPGLGRCPGEGKGYLLQCSGLENFMDWNNRLVPNRKRSMSRLYIVTLLI